MGESPRSGRGADLDDVGTAGQHRLIAHPQNMRFELISNLDRIAGSADDIAARDVDLILEGEGDGSAGTDALKVAVIGDDAVDERCAAGRDDFDLIARRDRPRDDRAGKTAEGLVRP